MTENDLDQENSDALRKSLNEYFGSEGDSLLQASLRNHLLDILFITIGAVISVTSNLKAVAVFGTRKQKWLTEILHLAEGDPSHATSWTIFALLDPLLLEKSFVSWVQLKFAF